MTYIFEENDPMILSAYRGFEELDAACGINNAETAPAIPLPLVELAAPEVMGYLNSARKLLLDAIEQQQSIVNSLGETHQKKHDDLSSLTKNRSRAGAGPRSSGRATTAQSYKDGTVSRSSDLASVKRAAEREVSSAKRNVTQAEKVLKEAMDAFDAWDQQYGQLLRANGVMQYGRSCIRPGHIKYREQFVDNGGRCTKLRLASRGAKVFDPFILKMTSIAALELIADELSYFESSPGTSLFTPQFIRLLKSEIPAAKEHAEKEFDWNSVPKSDNYRDRSHRRELKKEHARVRMEYVDRGDVTAEYEPYQQSDIVGDRREPALSDNWKDDLGEYDMRIWEWWRPRWVGLKSFTYFDEAIRKVVLFKLSSAIVERDFSQYVAVKNVCGNQLRKSMLQNRIMNRCNKSLYEYCESIDSILADIETEIDNNKDGDGGGDEGEGEEQASMDNSNDMDSAVLSDLDEDGVRAAV